MDPVFKLEKGFDQLLHPLLKGGMSLEKYKSGKYIYLELEQVKEWKSRYGFQFQIYPNDHFIDKKPHFHLIKRSEEIECRVFFDGTVYDYKGKGQLDRKTHEALIYFLENKDNQKLLIDLWNKNNPNFVISNIG